jgi:hypothetical protein
MRGGWGNARIAGGPGRDRLVGGPGRDRLSGGAGRDSCTNGERLIGCPSRLCLRNDEGVTAVRPERALFAFAASVFVFHHLPTAAGKAGDWIDLATPFAVVGAAAALLAELHPPRTALVLALVATLLYVDGHGIHLAANSVANESPTGEAEHTAHFWDERFSHVEWHLGLIGLIGAFSLAERAPVRPIAGRIQGATAILLGVTLFTSTVEGGTWWLALAATGVFGAWALRERRPILVAWAAAFVVAAVLIGIWALWQGGMPQFSEAGLI